MCISYLIPIGNQLWNQCIARLPIVQLGCSHISSWIFLPPFYAKAQAPKSSAQSVSQRQSIRTTQSHTNALTNTQIQRTVSVSLPSLSLSRSLCLSFCFTSASPTRNRNTEHEIRALHEYTVNTIWKQEYY